MSMLKFSLFSFIYAANYGIGALKDEQLSSADQTGFPFDRRDLRLFLSCGFAQMLFSRTNVQSIRGVGRLIARHGYLD
jgi:hypothetical protein